MTKLSPAARLALEDALHEEEPTAIDRARVRSRLATRIAQGAAGGAVVASTSAAAASAKLVGLAKLFGLIALLGTVGIVLSGAPSDDVDRASQHESQTALQPASQADEPPRPAPAPAQPTEERPAAPDREAARSEAARSEAARSEAPRSASGTEAPRAVSTPEARTAGARVQPRPANPPASEAPAVNDAQPQDLNALKAETALIKKAHLALRGGEAERALSLLERHAREHPRGQLGEEREAARALALCRLGRKDEARRAAARFLAERSPLAERIKSACGF
jgi:hypothetical protein